MSFRTSYRLHHTGIAPPLPYMPVVETAWRGDAALVRQLYEAGARLDVTGISRGEGPYSPIEWAERKVGVAVQCSVYTLALFLTLSCL